MKIRINDLARELEVKAKVILDILPEVGVTEKKTHSSSIEEDEAVKVRKHFSAKSGSASRERASATEVKPKIDLSKISKPGDVARLLKQREQEQQSPARPATPVAAPPAAATCDSAQRSAGPFHAGRSRNQTDAGRSGTASAGRGSRTANFSAPAAIRPRRRSGLAPTVSRQTWRTAPRPAPDQHTTSGRLSATSGNGRCRPRRTSATGGKTGTPARAQPPARPTTHSPGKKST